MTALRFILLAFWFNVKSALALKLAFWLNIAIKLVQHLLFALAWQPFYLKYHSINGWGYQHQLVMIALVNLGAGLAELLFDGLRDLPRIIESGTLDSYLLKPQDPILMIALSKTSLNSWSNVLAGIVFIKMSNLFDWVIVLFALLATLFFFSLYLYLGSLRFFINNSNSLIADIYSKTMLIATQPNTSYKGLLKIITFSILPVSLVSFFPVQYICEKNIRHLMIVVFGSVLFYIFSRAIFFIGLRRYNER